MDIQLDQLVITPKAESAPLLDLPLIDLCSTPGASLALGSESRPLIDLLTNTPDVSRSAVSKPLHEVGQVRSSRTPFWLRLRWPQFWVYSSTPGYHGDPGERPLRLLRAPCLRACLIFVGESSKFRSHRGMLPGHPGALGRQGSRRFQPSVPQAYGAMSSTNV